MKRLSEISAQVKLNAVSDKNIGKYFSINIISGGNISAYWPAGDFSEVLWRPLWCETQPGLVAPMNGGIYG